MVEFWPLPPPEIFPERARLLEDDGGTAEATGGGSRDTVDGGGAAQVSSDSYQQGRQHD